LRQIAVSRLLLDNFPHIKAYWQMLTPKIAQIALRFGADDLDGTVIEEKIYHDAGATTPQGMTRKDLCRLITEAGRVPVSATPCTTPSHARKTASPSPSSSRAHRFPVSQVSNRDLGRPEIYAPFELDATVSCLPCV